MKITVAQAAKALNVTPSVVRSGLRKGAFPFGTAYKNKTRWTYIIYQCKFQKYVLFSE